MNNKVLIHQDKLSDKHTDSLWYEGLIAETHNYYLFATGEVKGTYKGETYGQDGLISLLFEIGDKGLFDVEMIDNNWFEVIEKDSDTGEVYGDYDSAIKYLIQAEEEQTNGQIQ
jgi:hypothetical protein